jgi:(1->4)-alpha-D-glucan 1-alpha-D-glucosylmutase
MLKDLKKHADPDELLKHWHDGRLKMYLTWKALSFRRSHPDLFLEGEYIPLGVTGALENHVIAFARRLHNQWCVVAVPRLLATLTPAGSPPLGENVWHDTQIHLPSNAPRKWTNVLTGEKLSAALLCADLFTKLPVTVSTVSHRE